MGCFTSTSDLDFAGPSTAQLAGTRGTQIRCGTFPGHRPEVELSRLALRNVRQGIDLINIFYEHISFFWHLENMKIYENINI